MDRFLKDGRRRLGNYDFYSGGFIDAHLRMVKLGIRPSKKVHIKLKKNPYIGSVSRNIYKLKCQKCKAGVVYRFVYKGRHIKSSIDLKWLEDYRDKYFKTWTVEK